MVKTSLDVTVLPTGVPINAYSYASISLELCFCSTPFINSLSWNAQLSLNYPC